MTENTHQKIRAGYIAEKNFENTYLDVLQSGKNAIRAIKHLQDSSLLFWEAINEDKAKKIIINRGNEITDFISKYDLFNKEYAELGESVDLYKDKKTEIIEAHETIINSLRENYTNAPINRQFRNRVDKIINYNNSFSDFMIKKVMQ